MTHRLFFGIRLNPEACAMAVEAKQQQMDVHQLSGDHGHVAPERLHISLHGLGDYEELPPELLRRAKEAGSRVEMEPFDVGFDRIGSFGGPQMGGLALTGSAELRPLREFRRALTAAMVSKGLEPYTLKPFSPHVSLLYREERLPRESIAPIRWRVDELLLIESLLGQSTYVYQGHWPLRRRQMSFSW